LSGTGEVEQVQAFGVVELQGSREGIQDAVGHAVRVAALQAGVVRDADACEHGDLFAAQAGDAAAAVDG
jgi:hypothetical protein